MMRFVQKTDALHLYPEVLSRIRLNELIKHQTRIFFRDQSYHLTFNQSKKAVDDGVIAFVPTTSGEIVKYFIRPHHSFLKITTDVYKPIAVSELIVVKWLELMNIGPKIELIYPGRRELYIASKDFGPNFLTFEQLCYYHCKIEIFLIARKLAC